MEKDKIKEIIILDSTRDKEEIIINMNGNKETKTDDKMINNNEDELKVNSTEIFVQEGIKKSIKLDIQKDELKLVKDKNTIGKNKRRLETEADDKQQESIENALTLTNQNKKTKLEINKGNFGMLPHPVWDRLILFLPFNTRVQASQVCKMWKYEVTPYLWRKPSRSWFANIIQSGTFIESIKERQFYIRNLDCVPVPPAMLNEAVKLCYNLEGLVLNCNAPIKWKDEEVLNILSFDHLKYKLKHLIIFNLSLDFSKWEELSTLVGQFKNLVFLTLPFNFPYHTNFEKLPASLRFLNCTLDDQSYLDLLELDLSHFLGLTFNFLSGNINLENLLPRLKRLTTLSLEGFGYITKLNYLTSPKLLTGLKIDIDVNKEELLGLLKRCRHLVHVEFRNIHCDDKSIKWLLKLNPNLQVLKVMKCSVTTYGIANIFQSDVKLKMLHIECRHENCGPFNMELNKCSFLSKLTELNIDLTLYLTVKLLKALKFMKNLIHFQMNLKLSQVGNLDCHTIFTPSLPYLAFFPISTQLEYLIENWKDYFKFQCTTLTNLIISIDGDKEMLTNYEDKMDILFKTMLNCYPCVNRKLFRFLDQPKNI